MSQVELLLFHPNLLPFISLHLSWRQLYPSSHSVKTLKWLSTLLFLLHPTSNPSTYYLDLEYTSRVQLVLKSSPPTVLIWDTFSSHLLNIHSIGLSASSLTFLSNPHSTDFCQHSNHNYKHNSDNGTPPLKTLKW